MENDYTKLKSLLLQEEIDKIESLTLELSNVKKQQENDILVERLSLLITDILSKSIEANQAKFYATLQPIIAKGLVDELHSGNNDLKRILFPIIASAIQEQIHQQKETIIDALYPIMGNMISKYVTNAFRDMMYEINDKIHNSLSLEIVIRKIKAKIYRVSEAQLLMQEANFVDVRNVFLIHKESGLLITNVHKADAHRIDEAEMVASMLSAIRSFVNDWISSHNTINEISEIEYGGSSIVIESAGSCYLAIVLNGDSNIQDKTTRALAQIVDRYSKELTYYDGDSSTMDIGEIQKILYTLFETNKTKKERKTPFISIILLFILMAIPLYYYVYNHYKESQFIAIDNNIRAELKAKQLHVYDLDIDIVSQENITIAGLVLNKRDYEMTKTLFSGYQYHNQIGFIDDHFQRQYTKEELKKQTYRVNKEYDCDISYLFEGDSIKFTGRVTTKEIKKDIVERYKNLFDTYDLVFDITALPELNERVYFDLDSAEILTKYSAVLDKIAKISKDNTTHILKIIAYTDMLGSDTINQKISLQRVNNIKDELIKRGVKRDMIALYYEATPPPDISKIETEKEQSLSRCVVFAWGAKI